MDIVYDMKKKVLAGGSLTRNEALDLYEVQLSPLCEAANEIRQRFCGEAFDLCTIINGKSGKCSEDCKYCSQSSFYPTAAAEYSLLGTERIVEEAMYNEEKGVTRFSIVTSGKKLSQADLDCVCRSVRAIKEKTGLGICVSLGLLEKNDFLQLREAGAVRVHNNLETSTHYFPHVCTTHSYEDKIWAIEAAKEAGMEICSGGILGLGESREDRVDMALDLKRLSVVSVPVNVLSPVQGTPYEGMEAISAEEILRTIAVYRFLLPGASIRLAGGRNTLPDQGRRCFLAGANGTITGDLLTTTGISIEADKEMLVELGYKKGGCRG